MKFTILPVTAFQQNCSLIWCSQTLQAALIDPGGEVVKFIILLGAAVIPQ